LRLWQGADARGTGLAACGERVDRMSALEPRAEQEAQRAHNNREHCEGGRNDALGQKNRF